MYSPILRPYASNAAVEPWPEAIGFELLVLLRGARENDELTRALLCVGVERFVGRLVLLRE